MAVRKKEEALTIIRNHQQEIKDLGVRRYGFFGSFVREEATDQSDVDLVTVESLSPYIGPHILKEVEYASVSA